MRVTSKRAGLALAFALSASTALAGELVINADTSDPVPRKAWEDVVAKFKAENPSITVKFNVYDHESYKKSIRNWLSSASPDVVYWYSGNRLDQFVKPGLLEDLSPAFTDAAKAQLSPTVLDLVSSGGKQYAVPYTYYQWGMYYRKDLFEKAGITEPPKTWETLLDACDKLNKIGVAPIAIGTKDLWPTAGWFDYIDLRLNGYDFHMQLMSGKIPYTDARVKDVFAHWKALLDRQCFVKNHASSSWQESQSLLYQGKAASMLIGNFITQSFPADVAKDMAFTPFPTINPSVESAEDAPIDTVAIPAKAKNKADAMTFMAFVLRPEVQQSINMTTDQIPVDKDAKANDNRFITAGKELLSNAKHLAQFFDRDTSEDLATGGMKGFQEFMMNPSREDKVLEDLERARKRIYGG